jgi:formimidoylglutamate deiminase
MKPKSRQTMIFEEALTPGGFARDVLVTVEEGIIAKVASGVPSRQRGGARAIFGLALPGVGNLHSHSFQRGFAGLTERRGEYEDHFWTWRQEMYRFLARLSPQDVEAIAAFAFIEMIEAGFTCVAEFHYVHHQPDGRPYDDPAEMSRRIVAAAGKTGIGLTLLPVFYAHAGFGGTPPDPGQRRFICDLDRYAAIVEGAADACAGLAGGQVGIAPHSLRAVTAQELSALTAAYPSGPVHIHVAEQAREVKDCLAATGARPVEWLLDHAQVDARWCLIHATHMTQGETRRMAATGAVAGLCPITESNLGDGIFPAVDFMGAGGRFGIGSDSNVLISLSDELRMLEYSQRLRDQARNRLAGPGRSTGRRLFDAACAGGAQALDQRIGAIAPGHRADIMVVDTGHASLIGRSGDALIDSLIFATVGGPIRDVFVGGVQLVENGRHRARTTVEARWRAAIKRLAAG